MKTINLIYNSKGFLEEQYEDGSFYIAKEEDKALTFKATFPFSLVGSVRAYLQFRGGGDVVECGNININSHTIECEVDAKYLSYNFLKIGFEVITANKEIRFEPVTLEVDEFVNVGGKSSAEGYTVTVKVGNVTKLAPGEEPYVTNSGTAKDVVLNFGIPKGDKPEKGEDYFTPEEQEEIISDVLKGVEGYTFDYYYEEYNASMSNYDNHTAPGLYKIRHKAGNVEYIDILSVAYYFSTCRQIVIKGENVSTSGGSQIFRRRGDVMSGGNVEWGEWEDCYVNARTLNAALESKVDKTVVDELSYTFQNSLIECTSSGTAINIKDSADVKPRGLKLYGKTTQADTPSFENPQELISIGDSGKLDVELYGKNLFPNFITDTTLNKGSTVKVNSDGSLTVHKVAGEQIMSHTEVFFPKGTYTLSNGMGVKHLICVQAFGKTTQDSPSVKVEWGGGTTRLYLYASNTAEGDITLKPQIEFGTTVTPHEPFKKQSISVSTPNGLPGIPVTSDGNYTDENGQQYICDEVDVENKVHIHRLKKIDSYNGEEITTQYMSTTGELSTGATVIYVLEIPYETPLTDEEVEAYNSITMYKPVTNIFNSDNAQMKVDYVADTKAYIDNKFAELQIAIISTGGNV